MAELRERSELSIRWWGKLKPTAQMLALGVLLCRYNNYIKIPAIIGL